MPPPVSHAVQVLLGHALVGAGQALFMPGLMAYLSAVKQSAAGAIAAANMAVMFCAAGAMISAAVPMQIALGYGGLFGVLGGAHVLAITWAATDAVLRGRHAAATASRASVNIPLTVQSEAVPPALSPPPRSAPPVHAVIVATGDASA